MPFALLFGPTYECTDFSCRLTGGVRPRAAAVAIDRVAAAVAPRGRVAGGPSCGVASPGVGGGVGGGTEPYELRRWGGRRYIRYGGGGRRRGGAAVGKRSVELRGSAEVLRVVCREGSRAPSPGYTAQDCVPLGKDKSCVERKKRIQIPLLRKERTCVRIVQGRKKRLQNKYRLCSLFRASTRGSTHRRNTFSATHRSQATKWISVKPLPRCAPIEQSCSPL